MKTRYIKVTFIAAASITLSSGCVKDDIHNTDHPSAAAVTIDTRWTDRGEGVEKPTSYNIFTTGFEEKASTDSHRLGKYLVPGEYGFYLWNPAAGILYHDGEVSVESVDAPDGSTGVYVDSQPGWLFTAGFDARLVADGEYRFTARMRQQTRALTLAVEAEGSAADRITAIAGSLTGIAPRWSIDRNTASGEAVNVAPRFDLQPDGSWIAQLRLIGITGTEQILALEVEVDGPTGTVLEFESDLTPRMSGFNNDKTSPLVLTAKISVDHDPEKEAGFSGTIKDWESATGGTGIAN